MPGQHHRIRKRKRDFDDSDSVIPGSVGFAAHHIKANKCAVVSVESGKIEVKKFGDGCWACCTHRVHESDHHFHDASGMGLHMPELFLDDSKPFDLGKLVSRLETTPGTDRHKQLFRDLCVKQITSPEYPSVLETVFVPEILQKDALFWKSLIPSLREEFGKENEIMFFPKHLILIRRREYGEHSFPSWSNSTEKEWMALDKEFPFHGTKVPLSVKTKIFTHWDGSENKFVDFMSAQGEIVRRMTLVDEQVHYDAMLDIVPKSDRFYAELNKTLLEYAKQGKWAKLTLKSADIFANDHALLDVDKLRQVNEDVCIGVWFFHDSKQGWHGESLADSCPFSGTSSCPKCMICTIEFGTKKNKPQPPMMLGAVAPRPPPL